MKFYSNQLSQLIEKIAAGTIKSLLLYGHNRGLITAIIEQLIKKFDFFSVNLNGKEATEANLNLLANTSNFFKQKELIKIDYHSSAIHKELMQFLITGNFTNFICFIGNESLPNSGIKKVFEDSANMASIGCYYNDENMVIKLAHSIATKHQKILSEEALCYIQVSLKGDYQILKNELEKLINYTHDKDKITYEDVQAVLSLDLSSNGDEMCIFFSKKEPELFLAEVAKLRNQNISEVLIIRTLIRYYINLFIVCSKIADGINIDLAIKSLSPPVFFKYVSAFKANVIKLSLNDIVSVIDVLQKVEVKLKNTRSTLNFFVEVYLPAHDYAIH